jgi:K+ transporter
LLLSGPGAIDSPFYQLASEWLHYPLVVLATTEELFAFMHHNAQRPGAYFKIPSAQIMEIGVEFEI